MPKLPTSGVLVAAALLAAGAATAGLAWWHNLARTDRALEFWGPGAVALIRDAPRVAAYRLPSDTNRPAGSLIPSESLRHPATGRPAEVLEAHDVSRAKGLVHLRHALLDDRSFAWQERPSSPSDAEYALTFEADGSLLAVYFWDDFEWMAAYTLDKGEKNGEGRVQTVSTRPIAAGLRKYFSEIFAPDK